jgi:hypothetical protein
MMTLKTSPWLFSLAAILAVFNASRADQPAVTNAAPDAPPPATAQSFPIPPSVAVPGPEEQFYPWKIDIVAVVFQIGKTPETSDQLLVTPSAWNPSTGQGRFTRLSHTAEYDRSWGYKTTFYVALPFNDLAHPDLAQRWTPSSWHKAAASDQPPVSVCQHRWIEIKNRYGRVCYAKWEAVGPHGTGDAEYVFGTARPEGKTGLGISPAVAKYLGVENSGPCSWRFVDGKDVKPGMWLRYDEQSILLQALNAQAAQKK